MAELLAEIDKNPNLGNYVLGLLDFRLGKYSSAINHVKEYLIHDPNSYEGNFLLGEIYITTGEYPLAEDCLNHIAGYIRSNDDFERFKISRLLFRDSPSSINRDIAFSFSSLFKTFFLIHS